MLTPSFASCHTQLDAGVREQELAKWLQQGEKKKQMATELERVQLERQKWLDEGRKTKVKPAAYYNPYPSDRDIPPPPPEEVKDTSHLEFRHSLLPERRDIGTGDPEERYKLHFNQGTARAGVS